MNGIYLKDKSWEKQSYYKLDNGYTVRVEYNSCYGGVVAAIELNDEIIYHCSNGLKTAPTWIKEWIEPIAENHWQKLIRPRFTMIYNN
jgi:hypothetical protein